MDATVQGILYGITSSVGIALIGALAMQEDRYKWFVQEGVLFVWLVLLTALLVGTFVYTSILTTFLTEQPNQKANATVT
jgi:hypothetical protein